LADTLSNLVNGVTNTISGTITTGINTINGAIFGGQFLWDNAISPSLQVLQENSIDYIDNYFGNILGLIPGIGKRSIETRNQLKASFLELTNEFIAKLKQIFINFIVRVNLESQFSLNSVDPTHVIQQTITEINQLCLETYHNIATQFTMEPSLISGLGNIINQIQNTVLSAINQIASNMLP